MENPNLVQLDLSITLRDLFAGMAMQSVIAHPSMAEEYGLSASYEAEIAEQAYILADAMLAARKGDK